MCFIPNFLSLYQHFIKQELLVNVKRELQPFELTLRKSFFAQKAVHYRRRRHFATKNPSFCYTFILKNSFILLHPCTALALGSPHICSKLRDIKFLQQLQEGYTYLQQNKGQQNFSNSLTLKINIIATKIATKISF